MRSTRHLKMDFIFAPEIKSDLDRIIEKIGLAYIKRQNLVAFKSFGSKSRAMARIWSLPRIWQLALQTEAHYCIEVISEKFAKLSQAEKEKVLIHELLHIPKNFSGSLLSHRRKGRTIDKKAVDKLYKLLQKNG